MDHLAGERTGETEMKLTRPWMIAGLILIAPGAQAQLLPQVGQVVPDLLDRVEGAIDATGLDRLSPTRLADRLAAARATRITDLLRQHGDRIELDDRREPARRGLILLTGADAATLTMLRAAGYGVAGEMVEGLDLVITRLTPPKGRNLARALREVRRIAPHAQASADNLYFPSGPTLALSASALADGRIEGRAAGLIDGGVARHPSLTGPVGQRGFADGAPRASAHGTAVASLISGDGMVRGAAPGTPLLVADVYGNDPAGGSAFAIVRALGWMAARGVRVVTISLVGPANPLLDGAIRLARDKGVMLVAAVGNDGPAAPPAYPASYPDVVAVTGVDGRGRLLPEAGRALHVDFAAPGADMQAATMTGGKGAVRGTSFAAPLVAGRLFMRGSLDALRTEAAKGKPPLICKDCRNNE
ncbi:S8 family serine peptidase [Sphingobium sp. BYY-5]|uniref:S8 family serine peptidase n=1 Tax=Sphingobium sp. BYY-5 TaxID=2926400 RepID=UPI001FA7DF2C|nr:S8 family serine peptidase [Sphingobium sp. BYY-5]MCI4589691.1 S8 family serine peptidase [Sphingobium sp. BYY-5]